MFIETTTHTSSYKERCKVDDAACFNLNKLSLLYYKLKTQMDHDIFTRLSYSSPI